jgi:hypothetical protein
MPQYGTDTQKQHQQQLMRLESVCPLGRFLINRSIHSPQLANFFYWYLKVEIRISTEKLQQEQEALEARSAASLGRAGPIRAGLASFARQVSDEKAFEEPTSPYAGEAAKAAKAAKAQQEGKIYPLGGGNGNEERVPGEARGAAEEDEDEGEDEGMTNARMLLGRGAEVGHLDEASLGLIKTYNKAKRILRMYQRVFRCV